MIPYEEGAFGSFGVSHILFRESALSLREPVLAIYTSVGGGVADERLMTL